MGPESLLDCGTVVGGGHVVGGGGGGGVVRAKCTEEGDFAGCAGRVTAVSSGGGG